MGLNKRETNTIYLNITKGNITQKGKQGDEGIVAREYEDDDGNTKVVYEHQYSDISGLITGLSFRDGKFGEDLIVKIQDVDETYSLSVKTESRYFQDLAKKLPNVDFSKEVKLTPFDFEGDNGKPIRGVTLHQDDEKVNNFYWDADKKKDINDFPSVSAKDRKEFDSDDWKMYFIRVKKFLKKSVQSLDVSASAKTSTSNESPKAAVGTDEPDDLPF